MVQETYINREPIAPFKAIFLIYCSKNSKKHVICHHSMIWRLCNSHVGGLRLWQAMGKKGDVPVHARLTKHVFNLRDAISTQAFLKWPVTFHVYIVVSENTLAPPPRPGAPFQRRRINDPDSELAREMLWDVSRGEPPKIFDQVVFSLFVLF